MLESGVTEASDSPWASPVCRVKKKDGTFRFCVDYRRVNAVSRRDAFPISDIHNALDHLHGSRYFETIDLLSGYLLATWRDRPRKRTICILDKARALSIHPHAVWSCRVASFILYIDVYGIQRPPLQTYCGGLV